MISFFSNWLADFLCNKKIINSEEKEIYVYGYEIIVTTLLGAVLVFVIAAFLNRISETVVFFAVFVITRQFCGGYHAKTRVLCSISFIACYLLILFTNLVISSIYSPLIHSILLIPYAAVILGYAPIENENKPMDDTDKKNNRRNSILSSVVWILLSYALIFVRPIYASTIVLTLLAVAILMMIEIIKKEAVKK